MFGTYENFPENYHGIARFFYGDSTKELQRTIIYSLYRLNLGEGDLSFPKSTRYKMETILEFGVADGITFNYIDRETLGYCREKFHKQTFSMLDFLCIVRYYVLKKDKKKPLRFDYFILRFLFYEKEIEFQVFHEKGTQRLSIEDLIMILMKNINHELTKRKMSPLNMNYLHAL